MVYLLPIAFAALTLAAFVLPTDADRLRGALGLPAFALGAASIPFLPELRGPSLTTWISTGLLLLGPGMLLLVAWSARARIAWKGLTPAALAIALAAGVGAAWPTMDQGGFLPAMLTAGALGMATLFIRLLGSALGMGRAVRWLDDRMTFRTAAPPHTAAGRLPWLLSAGCVALLFIATPLAAHAAVAPETELWLTLVLAGLALVSAALWPVQRLVPGGPLSLVAGALLLRLGWGAWPLGMEHWQPIGVGIGLLSVLWAGPTRRLPLALAGAGVAACFSAPAAAPGAWLLLAAAAAAESLPRRTLALAAAAGGYLVAPPLLGAEVVWTVLLAFGAAMLMARGAPGADPAPDLSR